jgi:hypothetical protein
MFKLITNNRCWSIQDESSSAKRRRMVPEEQRKRTTIRSCRRCQKTFCPGNSDILKCPEPCTVPCKTCLLTEGCRGVDKGRKCTYVVSEITSSTRVCRAWLRVQVTGSTVFKFLQVLTNLPLFPPFFLFSPFFLFWYPVLWMENRLLSVNLVSAHITVKWQMFHLRYHSIHAYCILWSYN